MLCIYRSLSTPKNYPIRGKLGWVERKHLRWAKEIFSLFRRLNSENAYTGVGAGLALARKITELHSGVLTCCASPLGGAKFTFSLPYLPIIPSASH